MVDISPAAAREIERISNRQTSDSFLKLSVKPGGCSGLYYDLKLEQNQSDRHSSSTEGDRLIKINNINIYLAVDPESWKYVEHLKLDYAEDLMGGGFRFHHPQIKKFCGCGISFSEMA